MTKFRTVAISSIILASIAITSISFLINGHKRHIDQLNKEVMRLSSQGEFEAVFERIKQGASPHGTLSNNRPQGWLEKPDSPYNGPLFTIAAHPILYAVAEGHIDATQKFIQSGVDVTQTPLSFFLLAEAIRNTDIPMLTFLLERGCNPNADNSDPDPNVEPHALPALPAARKGFGPLHLITECRSSLIYDTRLTKFNVNRTPEIAALLIKYGADPNQSDVNGYTPLSFAVFWQNEEIVDVLLQHDADYTIKTKKGQSALELASLRANPKIITLLAQHGAPFTPDETVQTGPSIP